MGSLTTQTTETTERDKCRQRSHTDMPIMTEPNISKRRAVAAQTARSHCKLVYALFRDYRHTRASRLLESETWSQ